MIYCLARRIRGKVDWGSEGNSSHCAEAAQYRIRGTTETQNVALPFSVNWLARYRIDRRRTGAGPCVCSGDSENGGTCRFLKSQILFMLHPDLLHPDLHVWQMCMAFLPEQKGSSRVLHPSHDPAPCEVGSFIRTCGFCVQDETKQLNK